MQKVKNSGRLQRIHKGKRLIEYSTCVTVTIINGRENVNKGNVRKGWAREKERKLNIREVRVDKRSNWRMTKTN